MDRGQPWRQKLGSKESAYVRRVGVVGAEGPGSFYRGARREVSSSGLGDEGT